MADPCEKRLDLHFKQQLSEFDSSFKKIACKSDQIIINYWMHIYKIAPKEQKLSRNCLTLLMYGHLNEFGYLQYPFTDMRNCGKDLNEVLDAYKGLPYLRRVNFAHKGILFGSDTTISLDTSPSVLFNDYVLTDRCKEMSTSKQNSSSLTYVLPSRNTITYTIMPKTAQKKNYSNELSLSLSTKNSSSLSRVFFSKKTSTYTIMPKGKHRNPFGSFDSHECYTNFDVCKCLTERSSVYSVSKSNYTTTPSTYCRHKDINGTNYYRSNPTSSRIGSLTEDSFRQREGLLKKESFNTTFTNILESCRNMGITLTKTEPRRRQREVLHKKESFNTTFISILESCRNMGITLTNNKSKCCHCQFHEDCFNTNRYEFRYRPKGVPGFRIGAYKTVLHLTALRGLFSSDQVYIIPLLNAKQSWFYYRRTLLRNYTSLLLLHLLLKRKMLNEKMRLLLQHLHKNYIQCVRKVCSDVDTFRLKRRQLKWMLDGMESKYLHMTKVLILKVLHTI